MRNIVAVVIRHLRKMVRQEHRRGFCDMNPLLGLFPPSLEMDEPSSSSDVSYLRARYDYLNEYSQLDTDKERKNQAKKLYYTILEVLVQSRATCMCQITQCPELSIFEEQSPFEILRDLYKKPITMTDCFSPVAVQCLLLIILKIHKDPHLFAGYVYQYFSNEMSENLIFGYSTFPAIYGYFSNREFCKLAANFVMELIKIDDLEVLTDFVLPPFFYSTPLFYDYLWRLFHQKAVTFGGPASRSDCFNFFITSLKQAAELLPSSFVKVLKFLNNRNEEKAAQVIGKYIFEDTFEAYFSYSDRFLTIPIKFQMRELLKEFRNLQDGKRHSEVLSALLETKARIKKVPNKPPRNSLARIPFLMSNRDMRLVFDLMHDAPELSNVMKQLDRERSKFERRDRNIYVFDYFTATPSRPPSTVFFENIVGDAPRIWNNIVQLAKKRDLPPIRFYDELVLRKNLPTVSADSSIIVYGLKTEAANLHDRIEDLQTVIDTGLITQSYEAYIPAIESFRTHLLSANAHAIIGSLAGKASATGGLQAVDLLSLVNDEVSTVFSQVEAHEVLPFYNFIATLNRFSMLIDDALIRLQDTFKFIIVNHRTRAMTRIAMFPRAMGIIQRHAQNLSNACSERLGSRFAGMVALMSAVKEVSKATKPDSLRDFFMFGVSLVSEPAMFGSFMLLQRVVDFNRQLLSEWGEMGEIWKLFANEMMKIVSLNKLFEKQVLSYSFIRGF